MGEVSDCNIKYENMKNIIQKSNHYNIDELLIKSQKSSSELIAYDIKLDISSKTQFILTQEEEMITQSVFNHENLNRNILSHKSESLSKNAFNTLKPSVWLNDEVINLYSK